MFYCPLIVCVNRNWCALKRVQMQGCWTRTSCADVCSSSVWSSSSSFVWWSLPSHSQFIWSLPFIIHLLFRMFWFPVFYPLAVYPCLWIQKSLKALQHCPSFTLKMWLSSCFLLCSKFIIVLKYTHLFKCSAFFFLLLCFKCHVKSLFGSVKGL